MADEEEDYVESPYAAEMQRRREYTQDGLSASESHKPMAKVIWEASRADEGTISATGADVVAKALIMAGYGKLGQERPSCDQCSGSYPRDRWPGDQYDGHWDTCPNRPCGARAVGGYCIMPRGHNQGRADVPDNHMSREQAWKVGVSFTIGPEPELWKISPGPIMQIPEPDTDWADVERVLLAWELHDNGPSHFSRGLHLLAHLKRGGTLEEYGMPR